MEQDKVSTTDWERPLEEVVDPRVFRWRVRALPVGEVKSLQQLLAPEGKPLMQTSNPTALFEKNKVVMDRIAELQYRGLETIEEVHERMWMSERVWAASVVIRQRWGRFVEDNLTPEEKCIKEAHNVELKAMQKRAQQIRQKSQNS